MKKNSIKNNVKKLYVFFFVVFWLVNRFVVGKYCNKVCNMLIFNGFGFKIVYLLNDENVWLLFIILLIMLVKYCDCFFLVGLLEVNNNLVIFEEVENELVFV